MQSQDFAMTDIREERSYTVKDLLFYFSYIRNKDDLFSNIIYNTNLLHKYNGVIDS